LPYLFQISAAKVEKIFGKFRVSIEKFAWKKSIYCVDAKQVGADLEAVSYFDIVGADFAGMQPKSSTGNGITIFYSFRFLQRWDLKLFVPNLPSAFR
jgi:hypothetical protein